MKKSILTAAAVLALASCGVARQSAATTAANSANSGAAADDNAIGECVAPPFLVPGDKIALLSPSYYTPRENADSAAAVLRSWGYEPVIGANFGKLFDGQYAGTLEDRLSDLRAALRDTTVKAIICARGGYGSIKMIDSLSAADFAADPKWLVGYSDITTQLGMSVASGVMCIHGTMGNSIAEGRGEDVSSRALKALLEGEVPSYSLPAHPQNIPGKACGVLVGGNLCTFEANLGTWADITSRDGFILFLEEVGEDMHHIDRLFYVLVMHGLLERCRGIIMGDFTDCRLEFDSRSAEEMLANYLEGRNIPLMCGFPAGHEYVKLPLVMGSRATMEVTPEGASLSFDLPGEVKRIDIPHFRYENR